MVPATRTPPPCPIIGFEFIPFDSWERVRQAVERRVSLFYWAPLDFAPRCVFVVRAFKNGKLRIAGGEITFTADSGHLDRFFGIQAVSR